MVRLNDEQGTTVNQASLSAIELAYQRAYIERLQESNQAKRDLVAALRRLAESDTGDGPIFPQWVTASLGRMSADLYQLAAGIKAAAVFAKSAPYSLAVLQQKAHDGDLPDGYSDHQIVEIAGRTAIGFSLEGYANANDVVRIPTLLHDAVVSEYAKPSEVPELSVDRWLQNQPYDVQLDYGIKTMRELGIIE